MEWLLKREVKTICESSTVISSFGDLKKANKRCIVFVPGNPGIIEFYDVFLTELHKLTNYEVPVYGIAQGGTETFSLNFDISSRSVQ